MFLASMLAAALATSEAYMAMSPWGILPAGVLFVCAWGLAKSLPFF
jgi:hypothetical protein